MERTLKDSVVFMNFVYNVYILVSVYNKKDIYYNKDLKERTALFCIWGAFLLWEILMD